MFSLDLKSKDSFAWNLDYYVESQLGLHRPVFVNDDHLILIVTGGGVPASYYIYLGDKTVMKCGPLNTSLPVLSIQYHDNEFIANSFPQLFLTEYALLTDYPTNRQISGILGVNYCNLAHEIDDFDGLLVVNKDCSDAVVNQNESKIPLEIPEALYSYLQDTMESLGINKKLFYKLMQKAIVIYLMKLTPANNRYIFSKLMIKSVLALFFDTVLTTLASDTTDRESVREELRKK